MRMLSSPPRILTYIDLSILWKHPTLLPVLTTPAAVIPVLGGGAELMVLTHALAGALVSVAQFARDARRLPLSVGRMTIDADKIDNNGVNKGKAVVVLHVEGTCGLSGQGAGCRMPSPWQRQRETRRRVTRVTSQTVRTAMGAAVGAPQEPVKNAPAVTQDGTVQVEEILEKLMPEGTSVCSSAYCAPASTPNVPCRTAKFCVSDTHDYLHILPACPFSRAAATPVDIEHSSFKSLSVFLRASEKGGLLRLNDARPGVQVAALFPTHADAIAHETHRRVGGEDERRQRAEEREAQQAAEAANAGKTTTVTELWKPHFGTLLLFGDLGLDITASYPLAEVKSVLFTYVEKLDLVNCFKQQFITTNSHAVFATLYGSPNAKGTTPAPGFAKREEALSALCKHMQPSA
ncbi:hypothetical protein EDB83DRAFT_2524259 [Lactarius deliciosus]|nr:hypothetical protein EDB83DRAFT_2524259 [Lactarius deliciosus]